MGIFDIFRSREKKESDKFWMEKIDQEIKEKGFFTAYNFIPNIKPRKEFRIRTCKECGKSVKHTCISERRKTVDVGGTESISQIWAIANHRYRDQKCRGSNRRYKKQFYK